MSFGPSSVGPNPVLSPVRPPRSPSGDDAARPPSILRRSRSPRLEESGSALATNEAAPHSGGPRDSSPFRVPRICHRLSLPRIPPPNQRFPHRPPAQADPVPAPPRARAPEPEASTEPSPESIARSRSPATPAEREVAATPSSEGRSRARPRRTTICSSRGLGTSKEGRRT